METIYISKTDKGFVVQQGDKYADQIAIDEVLGIVAYLLMKADPERVKIYDYWMQTREGHIRQSALMKSILDELKEKKICGK